MCLPLLGRKSTTYLQKLLVFHLLLFSRQVVYSYLALSMRLTCKIKKTTKTKNIKFGSLSLSLSLSSFQFALFKLSSVSRLLSSSLCHHHVTTSLSFYHGQNGLRLSIFSSFLIFFFFPLF